VKITNHRLQSLIDEVLYLRKVCIYEIRYMGEDLLCEMNERRKNKNSVPRSTQSKIKK